MPWWVWIAGIGLFIVAALALWYRFGNPVWVAGLVKSFVTMAFNALLPKILQRMTESEEREWHETIMRGEEWDYHKNRPKRR
jgi:hypothetical protein